MKARQDAATVPRLRLLRKVPPAGVHTTHSATYNTVHRHIIYDMRPYVTMYVYTIPMHGDLNLVELYVLCLLCECTVCLHMIRISMCKILKRVVNLANLRMGQMVGRQVAGAGRQVAGAGCQVAGAGC